MQEKKTLTGFVTLTTLAGLLFSIWMIRLMFIRPDEIIKLGVILLIMGLLPFGGGIFALIKLIQNS